jgi:hypothetical protein
MVAPIFLEKCTLAVTLGYLCQKKKKEISALAEYAFFTLAFFANFYSSVLLYYLRICVLFKN